MKLRIIEESKNLLRIELEGEGHTLCNLLQDKLLEEDGVEIAGYDKHHPLAEQSILYVRTEGETSARRVLIAAAEKALKTTEEFRGIFEKELSSAENRINKSPS